MKKGFFISLCVGMENKYTSLFDSLLFSHDIRSILLEEGDTDVSGRGRLP